MQYSFLLTAKFTEFRIRTQEKNDSTTKISRQTYIWRASSARGGNPQKPIKCLVCQKQTNS